MVRKEGGCGWAREDGGRGGEGAGDLRRTFANGADEDGGTDGGCQIWVMGAMRPAQSVAVPHGMARRGDATHMLLTLVPL